MRTADLRASFLDYFETNEHHRATSAPLVPANDPTVLFTVAGMVQFKDALLGNEKLDYDSATSCQRCLRAGGKHNDLDNVGYTPRHHTFFEMLGNFSFGGYFKERAIDLAWDFVVQELKLEKDRIWITVHPTDREARELWHKKIGIKADRIVEHEDNFWSMGETGPCGPCSEIFYDQGPSLAGGPPGSKEEDGDRVLEFWNLVFPQFDRQPDGGLDPLDQPGVDTGMGLERTAALMQHVTSNYEIDIFEKLLQSIGSHASISDREDYVQHPSVRVVADHYRAIAFLIADGIFPGREGRGYVLRRIIRRAIRHSQKLEINQTYLHTLLDPLLESMGDAYPELQHAEERIRRVVQIEEEQFASTLKNGLHRLDRAIADSESSTLNGETAFNLYDTYGLPLDLMQEASAERGFQIDVESFEKHLFEQREKSKAASKFDGDVKQQVLKDEPTVFEGYTEVRGPSQIASIYQEVDGRLEAVEGLATGSEGFLILTQTGFYPEAGGQVGDTGEIRTDSGTFRVQDTTNNGKIILHRGVVNAGFVEAAMDCSYEVGFSRRQDIMRNHTATHLLHAALRCVLGSQVQQRGSLVAPDRLRFDFTHHEPIEQRELADIEDMVNDHVLANTSMNASVCSYETAMDNGAIALFGEKYGDEVRVLTTANGFSSELCGGTHVSATGEIGLFQIVSHSGIAAGIRRIEAITGRQAVRRVKQNNDLLEAISARLNTTQSTAIERIDSLLDENQELHDASRNQSLHVIEEASRDLAKQAKRVNDTNILSAQIEINPSELMAVMDALRPKLGKSVILLGVIQKDEVQLVCGVSNVLTEQIHAGELIRFVGDQVGARGGGRPQMARAGGGKKLDNLQIALDSVAEWVLNRLDRIA